MFAANRRNWDELTAAHLAPGGYNLEALRRGEGRLFPIEEAELPRIVPDLSGRRIIHLQCHIGDDTLTLAQRGATVVGVDFSPAAIRAARDLASELGLADRARFVECNLYDAPAMVGEPGSFDLAFTTWGTIGWLPDIRGWARVAAQFLKPGGSVYLADGHPAALVLDDVTPEPDGRPGWFAPYFGREPLVIDDPTDYINREARIANSRTYCWLHPLGDVVSALMKEGLALTFLHEHDAVPWQMFACLDRGEDRMFRWPDKVWWPLSFSLAARKVDAG